jgi:hypothetical protein
MDSTAPPEPSDAGLSRGVSCQRRCVAGVAARTAALMPVGFVAGFFLPTVEFLPLSSGNGSYRGIPRYTAKYRSNSNFKPKTLKTASSNGMERYTAV